MIENFQELTISVLIAIVCFIIFMMMVNRSQNESVMKRLKRLAPSKEEASEFVERNREGQVKGFAATLEPLLKMLGLRPSEFRRIHFYRFYRAGVDPVDGPIYYLAWKWFATPVALLIGIYFISLDAEGGKKLMNAMMAIIVFVIAFYGGDLFLKNQRDKRAKVLTRAFPDALDLLLVCTESGLALDGALGRV